MFLVDYKGKRWEFNVDEAEYVARDLAKALKASYAIDVCKENKTESDETEIMYNSEDIN